MSVHLQYRLGSDTIERQLLPSDADVLQVLAKEASIDKHVNMIMGVQDFGISRTIQRTALRQSLVEMIDVIERRGRRFPIRYGLKIARPSGLVVTASGTSGQLIGGRLHSISTGSESVIVEIGRIDSNGKWATVESFDGRHLKKLVTDDGTIITVTRRSKPSGLLVLLNDLLRFVDTHSEEYVEQTLL